MSASEIHRPDVAESRELCIEAHCRELPAVDLVFIDESGTNTNLCPTHGRAPRGQRVKGHRPFNRGTNQTIVGAIGLTGLLTHRVLDGAMTKSRFIEWVKQDLVPRLWPGAVVILDNLRAHHAIEAREAVEAVGACMLHLPPYSPDLNPIEPCWAKLKNFLRKAAARTVEALRQAIDEGMRQIVASNCQGWFKHCGWTA